MIVKLIKFSKSLFGPSFNVLLLSYSHIKEYGSRNLVLRVKL